MRKKIKHIIHKFFIKKLERQPKVFCISMQRAGTTSVGQFFIDHGFRWSGWSSDRRNNWSQLWAAGESSRIFNSDEFRTANAYEDSPWWFPDFYKELHAQFPDAKFILLQRESNNWYRSMISHSGGNVIGSTVIHCKIYKREKELEALRENGVSEDELTKLSGEKPLKMNNMEEYYIKLYEEFYSNAISYFSERSPGSLFYGRLEDPEKWLKIGHFLNVRVSKNYDAHKNKSKHT